MMNPTISLLEELSRQLYRKSHDHKDNDNLRNDSLLAYLIHGDQS